MKTIKVTTFKEFIIEYEDHVIAIDKTMTRQMSSLLQTLIYYHKHGISKADLMDILWTDNANPQNAMKYSIFRLRNALNEIEFFKGLELIGTTKNGYTFAPNFQIETDFEKIEELWSKMNNSSNVARTCKQILSLFKGPFCNTNDTPWAMRVRSYFQNIYEKTFEIYCEDLIKKKSYREIISLSQQAIGFNEFNEEAYSYSMRSHIELGEYNKARQLYQEISTHYEQEYGMMPASTAKTLNQILTTQEEAIIDVESLKQKLNSNMSDAVGAFYCEYEFFKYIYQVSLRNAIRERKKMFLLIFQLSSKEDEKKILQQMVKLKTIIGSQLRSGDVYSKINKLQIVILVPCETMENGYSIIQRITSMFYRKVNKDKAKLHYFISSLNDFDEKPIK